MRLNIMNIPVHKNCTNCGKCCGIIPATTEEVAEIRKYIVKNSIKPISNHKSTCPFRDEVKKKCLIYPVRPLICRLYGVAEGNMECPNGNSDHIDGRKFLEGIDMGNVEFLNCINWRDEVGK